MRFDVFTMPEHRRDPGTRERLDVDGGAAS
jgi:hypothetical protein